jgi:transposase
MYRPSLSDAEWARLEPKLISIGLYETPRLKLTLEGVLWRIRTGAPWRDLPTELGAWSSTYNQFNRWSATGKWDQLFKILKVETDWEWSSMDGTIVRAHQHASGAANGAEAAIGTSRGGKTTKIHMLCDSHGNPVFFEITEGQVHDMKMAEALLIHCQPGSLINDKGYDSDSLRGSARAKGIFPIIPRRENSVKPNSEFDSDMYKLRHLIENLFARLKHFRAFSTRYDKLKRNFSATVSIACSMVWLRLF